MFQLINAQHQQEIIEFVTNIQDSKTDDIVVGLKGIIEQVRTDIPEKKRISYGRYSVIKKMGIEMYPLLFNNEINIFDFALKIFNNADHEVI